MKLTDGEIYALIINFKYNKENGIILSRTSFGGWSESGYLHKKDNRWRIAFRGKQYKRYQLVYLFETGNIPEMIDHIDGDTINDRFSNLRSISGSESERNKSISKYHKTGIYGVHSVKRTERSIRSWHAYILDCDSKSKVLYKGLDFFEACCARKSAERIFGYGINHGRGTYQK